MKRSSNRSRVQRSRQARLGIEQLEARQLMAGITASLTPEGVLVINGTAEADEIVVLEKQGRISILGLPDTYDVAGVKQIKIDAGGGDDFVSLGGLYSENSELPRFELYDSVGRTNRTFGRVTVPAEINGGGGNDTIYGGAGNDRISGDSGDDRLFGGDDRLFGGDGNDSLRGGAGNDTLRGEAGDDDMRGGIGNDSLHGDAGNDVLKGERGDDVLNGGDGNDKLDGGAGNDKLNGGTRGGIFYLSGGTGEETLLTGEVTSDSASSSVVGPVARILSYPLPEVSVSDGDDVIKGGAGDDILDGGSGNDKLRGGTGNDVLLGGDGDDKLCGEQGRDLLIGGQGADQLDGGKGGKDILIGGSTQHDYYDEGLLAILKEWNSGNSIQTRLDHLTLGGGLNQDSVFTLIDTPNVLSSWDPSFLYTRSATVTDDLAADTIRSRSGGNWVFEQPLDKLSQKDPTDARTKSTSYWSL